MVTGQESANRVKALLLALITGGVVGLKMKRRLPQPKF